MKYTSKLNFVEMAVAIALFGAVPAMTFAAAPEGSATVKAYVNQADLIFRGRVEKIQYAMSAKNGPQGQAVPYTFVTFRVDRTMKGKVAGSSVTLRLLGGLDKEHGLFMSSDQTPLFDVGDDDVLFVRSQADELTPLVRHKDGRYRIIADQVYTNDGEDVILEDDNVIRAGERHAFEEVLSTNVAGRMMKSGSENKAALPVGPTKAAAASAFEKAIEDAATQAPSGAAVVYSGADPGLAPAFPRIEAAAPPSR